MFLIAPKFEDEVGLHRDDGIRVCKATPREIEKRKPEVSNVFKSNGLKITIEANNKIKTSLMLLLTFQVEATSHTTNYYMSTSCITTPGIAEKHPSRQING